MRCEDVRIALACGEASGPELRAHLAGCPRCREAEAVVQLAASLERAEPAGRSAPTLAWLQAESARRRALRGAMALAATLLVSALGAAWLSRPTALEPPDPDLVAVVASLEETLWGGGSADLPGAEGIALLDPYGDDWAPPYEPLTDALLGAGAL